MPARGSISLVYYNRTIVNELTPPPTDIVMLLDLKRVLVALLAITITAVVLIAYSWKLKDIPIPYDQIRPQDLEVSWQCVLRTVSVV